MQPLFVNDDVPSHPPPNENGDRNSTSVSSPSRGRSEAAEAIWNWRERPAAAAKSRARLHGVVRALLGALVGAFLWTIGSILLAKVALTISAISLLLTLAVPDTLERFSTRLSSTLGALSTWTLMTIVFFGFFVPFRLLARRGRRDTMKRYLDRSRPTYWTQRPDGNARQERPF